MPKRDPYAVLGVEPSASAAEVKAAWRRLARRHHPDLTGGDAAAARVATRQMAEINAAYESLRTDSRDAVRGRAPARTAARPASAAPGARPRRSGPPRPKPARPVTGRLDTSDTFRPRNQTTTGGPAYQVRFDDQPPPRATVARREPPRASDPNGPLQRARVRHFRPPARPPLDEARALVVEFGKFRGHTLGEIADFEPSYIDWISATISKDPGLLAAARVVRDDLDQRGVVRRRRAGPDDRRAAPEDQRAAPDTRRQSRRTA